MSNVLISISHSSQDTFVSEFQQALADLKRDVCIDSRDVRGGDPLWSEIQKAIGKTSAYDSLERPYVIQSDWVIKELRQALDVQETL